MSAPLRSASHSEKCLPTKLFHLVRVRVRVRVRGRGRGGLG